MKHNDKLIVFTAPSGAGKTTLVKYLLSTLDQLTFSVSATTREKRANETHGKDYYFLSKADFKQKLEKSDFLEWQEVYDGNYYGTLQSEIERIFALGKHIIFDVDVQGALNIKKMYGDQVLTVFVMPPNVETLRQRLLRRQSETPETLQRRVDKAVFELSYSSKFDTTVLNDDLVVAKADALKLVQDFLN